MSMAYPATPDRNAGTVHEMRKRVRQAVDAAYRTVSRPPYPEDPVEIEPGVVVPRFEVDYAERAATEAERFLGRFPPVLDVADRTVLDVGCGAGELCLEVARRGARQVLGIDVMGERVALARARVEAHRPPLPVEVRQYGGDLGELDGRRFDVILSKDAFEHFGAGGLGPPPEAMVPGMAAHLVDGGLLALGFGPLWKAPFGGHIDSRLPWAHLLFPERVIVDEFLRVRPPGKRATTVEEAAGVNRMTLGRFEDIMESSGLECVHLATNVGRRRVLHVMRAGARLGGLREYLTQNVYGLWRRPSGWNRA
jgi:2-polyprenyl-3-methyl-5-hydroxy-6-metoxy-1,4-benzoquinol methylase